MPMRCVPKLPNVTLGVIVVQNKTLRVYSEEDVDVLQALVRRVDREDLPKGICVEPERG